MRRTKSVDTRRGGEQQREQKTMEQSATEREIKLTTKQWIDEYGEEFLVELIGAFLEDASSRVARLRQAVAAGDAETLTLEAHTLKSSSASLGAQSLSVLAKRLEEMGRDGAVSALADDVSRFEEQFTMVKAILEKLRNAPSEFLTQER